ncbi:MAG TPA: hypothetical protein VJN02_07820 [Gammaproteobacteria bacterium]|nr:hypothetical protein [Gammaproteobacteria bacterium]
MKKNLLSLLSSTEDHHEVLADLFKQAILEQDFASAHEIIQHIPLNILQEEKLYLIHDKPILSLIFDTIKNDSDNDKLNQSHKMAIIFHLSKVSCQFFNIRLQTHKNKINAINTYLEQVINRALSNHQQSISEPEPFLSFINFLIQDVKSRDSCKSMRALTDSELINILTNIAIQACVQNRRLIFKKISCALNTHLTLPQNNVDELHNIIYLYILYEKHNLIDLKYQKKFIKLLIKVDYAQAQRKHTFLHEFHHLIKIWGESYYPTKKSSQINTEQLFITDKTFRLYWLCYEIQRRHEIECDFILKTDEDTAVWLINSLRCDSASLKQDDKEWFAHLLNRNGFPKISQDISIAPVQSIPCEITESQKNLILMLLTYRRTSIALNNQGKTLPKKLDLTAIKKLNYRQLIADLKYMNLLPDHLREPFLKHKGYYTLLNTTEPQILTAEEKLIYQTLMNCNWKITHWVRSCCDLEKIKQDQMIYSVLARKTKNVTIRHQMTPCQIPYLPGYVFCTIGPEKTPIPYYLRYSPAFEIDVNNLLKVNPRFFKKTQLSLHWFTFFKDETLTPTQYGNSILLIYHKNNCRYSKYMGNDHPPYIEKQSLNQGIYSGTNILHILTLLFILKLRYIGGNYYNDVINNPTNIQLLSNSYCEILNPSIIELQCLFAIPLDSSYTRIISAEKKIYANEEKIRTALQDIQLLKTYTNQELSINQDVIVNINGYYYIGNILARAIAENKSEAIIDFILKHSIIDINFNGTHVNTLLLAVNASKNYKLLEKILTNKFPLLLSPNTSRIINADLTSLLKLVIDCSIISLSFLLPLTTEDNLTRLLASVVSIWQYHTENLPKIIETATLLLKNGADSYPALQQPILYDCIPLANLLLKTESSKSLSPSEINEIITHHLSKDNITAVDFVLQNLTNLKSLTSEPQLFLLIILGISERTSSLKIVLKKICLDKIDAIDTANHQDLIPFLVEIVKKNTPQEYILHIPNDINMGLREHSYIYKNINANSLKRFLNLFSQYNEHDLFTACNQQGWLYILNVILQEKTSCPIAYLLEEVLTSTRDNKWISLGELLINMPNYLLPSYCFSEMDLCKMVALLIDFPETIPHLILVYIQHRDKLSMDILLNLLEPMLEINFNDKTFSYQKNILDNLDIAGFFNKIITENDKNSLMLVAKCLLILMHDDCLLFQATTSIAHYIKDNYKIFNKIEEHLDIPSYIVAKLKILFHHIDPEIFPPPILSTSNKTWATLNNLLKPSERNKLWYDYYTQFDTGEDLPQRCIGVGVAMITCIINNKSYIYLGNKKSTILQSPLLLAPGGYIHIDEDVFLGTIREVKEETGFSLDTLINPNIYPDSIDNYLLEELGRLDLAYSNNNMTHQGRIIIRQLYEYDNQDNFNRLEIMTNYNISFYWLDFNMDMSQHFSSHDDFSNGQWVPMSEIIFHPKKKKYYYNETEIAISNALLIQKMLNKPIPYDAIKEAIYEERHIRHTQYKNLFSLTINQAKIADTSTNHLNTPQLEHKLKMT